MKLSLPKINIVLIVSILLSNIFLNEINFRVDFILVGIFIVINIKTLFNYLKEHSKVLLLLLIGLIGFYFIQFLILYNFSINLNNLYEYRYVVTKPLFPILLFITILSLNISKENIQKLTTIFIIITFIVIGYGFINYIFQFNLNMAGVYALSDTPGRITSFFTNPNAYGIFLVCALLFFLFYYKTNNIIRYSLVILIMISICLTYGRVNFVLMALAIIIYLLYVIFNNGIKKKIKEVAIILVFVLSLFVLPDYDYLFYSVTNKIDSHTKLNTSQIIYDINNKINIIQIIRDKINNNKSDDEPVYKYLDEINSRENSSAATRELFKETSIEIIENNSIIGVGALNYYKEVEKIFDQKEIDYVKPGLPHNIYLLFLARDGYIGGIIFFAILMYIGYIIIKRSNNVFIVPLSIYSLYLLNNYFADMMIGEEVIYAVYIIIAFAMLLPNIKNNDIMVTEDIHKEEES